MTSTGIVRRIDGLGRIVLPKELRATLDLNDRDPLEIYTEGNTIILKSMSLPVFSATAQSYINYWGRNICKACIDRLKKILIIKNMLLQLRSKAQ